MVLGLPRSGTAWMANYLTTDNTLCLHESFMDFSLEELDGYDCGYRLGIAETAGMFIADEINQHPARKIIIERPLEDVNQSLQAINLPCMTEYHVELLNKIDGFRVKFNELFNPEMMSYICREIVGIKFNIHRFVLLEKMNVQDQYAIRKVKAML